MSETGQVRFGASVIEYRVVRSARRRKTIEITLDPSDSVLVAAPLDTPPERVRDVVAKRATWIIHRVSASGPARPPRRFVSGESLPYLGRQARLFVTLASVRDVRVTFTHWSFTVTAPVGLTDAERGARIERALVRWYRERAAGRLADRVRYWGTRAGVSAAGVLIRDQRQRWASCSPDGVLRFNWRIVMAPAALLDYVVVHELVHLRLRTHTAAFWEEVARLMPDYKLRRVRLKEVGPYCTL